MKNELLKINGGLDLPIAGEPNQVISSICDSKKIGIIGADYIGLKPTMAVREGDRVKKGQILFSDKKNELTKIVSPISGKVSQINRGARRVLQSVVIDCEGDEEICFEKFTEFSIENADREKIRNILVESGQWVALKTRPYSKVPDNQSIPNSIFVTASDSNPLSANPDVVVKQQPEYFSFGMRVLCKLCDGNIHLCTDTNSDILIDDMQQIKQTRFAGKHPVGLAGTHIHFLDPVSSSKTVWVINYQDVIAFGYLFLTGNIYSRRIIAIAGPQVKAPRLVETILGADLDELMRNELFEGESRVISGSVLSGRESSGNFSYLGRYHNQISVIEEGRDRQVLHFLRLGSNKHSALPIFISNFTKKLFNMTSSTNGSERAMVPVGGYEDVTVLDILPAPLLKSLIVKDTEMAQNLGCLELDEEDMGLYTYVCVGKHEYGSMLRENLTQIEKEG